MWVEQARAALQVALDALDHCIDAPPAQPVYTARTDRFIEPKPTLPTLGPAGFSFIDPAFQRRILRVTDGTGGLTWRVPSNANVCAWSADSAHFYIVNGGGGVQVMAFDAGAFQATYVATPYSQTEPDFSRSDPDVLYTIAGPKTRTIRSYSLSTGAATDVLDLDSLGLPNLDTPRTYCGGVLSAGDVISALFGGTGQDLHHYLIHGSQILDSLQRGGYYLHGFSVDLTGRRMLLYPVNAQPYQVVVWDTQLDTLTPVTKSPAGHGAMGYGLWVNQDQGALPYDACQWQLRELVNLDATRDLIDPVNTPKEIYLADHTSWHNAKRDVRVPIISATYRYGSANTTPWRAWDDEIIAIATQGESTVWRFAHHRSDVSTDFWSQPLVNVSPNGRFAIFTSNWESSVGAGRTDVFLIELS